MNKIKFFGMLCVLLLSGCGTIQALSAIENHAGNIEVKLSLDGSTLEWQSQPDFKGEISLEAIKPCEKSRIYVGAGFLNKDLEELKEQFLGLNPNPWYPKFSKEKANELLSLCDILVFEKGIDSGKAVSLNFVNNGFETIYIFQMSQRESVPIKDWPYLSLAVLVDIPVVLITAPLVIVGFPFLLLSESLKSGEAEEGKSAK